MTPRARVGLAQKEGSRKPTHAERTPELSASYNPLAPHAGPAPAHTAAGVDKPPITTAAAAPASGTTSGSFRTLMAQKNAAKDEPPAEVRVRVRFRVWVWVRVGVRVGVGVRVRVS